MHRFVIIGLALALICLAPGLRAEQGEPATAWSQDQYSRIRLVSAVGGTGGGTSLLMGVEITTRPGWKTYWRAAGETGLPPQFNWLETGNTTTPVIMWPAPSRFTALGGESYGYTDGVILPFLLQPTDPARPVHVRLEVHYAVCHEICVPEQAELSFALEPGVAMPTAAAEALRAAVARVPVSQGAADLPRIVGSTIEPGEGGSVVTISATSSRFEAPDLFVDGAPDFLFSAPQISFSDDRTRAQFILHALRLDPDLPLNGQQVTLTLVDADRAIQHTVRLSP